MSILDTELQYYPSNIRIAKPKGVFILKDLLKMIQYPDDNTKKIFEDIREATLNKDEKRKQELKEHLFYTTPCVITNGRGRSYDNLIDFTELMVFEFDKITFAKELKQYLFDNLKCIIAAFTSPSGKGCKFIAKIPKCNSVEEYKQFYCGLSYYLQYIKGYDLANYNPLLPLYLSYDPEMLIRDENELETWVIKGDKLNTIDTTVIVKPENNVNTRENENIINNLICTSVGKISDNGHPQILRIATLLGGYVGYGYLSQLTAESIIENCIDNNSYLSKDIKGYKRTAKQMIIKGARSPISLNYEKTNKRH